MMGSRPKSKVLRSEGTGKHKALKAGMSVLSSRNWQKASHAPVVKQVGLLCQ